MKVIHVIAFILLVVGGLNWGLIGLFDWNLVASWFGGAADTIYILVGLSALWELFTHSKHCRSCKANS